ncbi:unnamed protein product [Larinioides sclopetarius]|uniref:Uncharacterized protein n=1 Tax=Larinioides sclopetarius TaxID=280406 RepID=A0AAV2BPG7_9ARAC
MFGTRIERDLINCVCGFSAGIPRSWIRWGTITCQISPHHLEYHFSSFAEDVLRKTAGGGGARKCGSNSWQVRFSVNLRALLIVFMTGETGGEAN